MIFELAKSIQKPLYFRLSATRVLSTNVLFNSIKHYLSKTNDGEESSHFQRSFRVEMEFSIVEQQLAFEWSLIYHCYVCYFALLCLHLPCLLSFRTAKHGNARKAWNNCREKWRRGAVQRSNSLLLCDHKNNANCNRRSKNSNSTWIINSGECNFLNPLIQWN